MAKAASSTQSRCSGGHRGQAAGDPLAAAGAAPCRAARPAASGSTSRLSALADLPGQLGGVGGYVGDRRPAGVRRPARAARRGRAPRRPGRCAAAARNRSTTPGRSTRRGSRRRAAHPGQEVRPGRAAGRRTRAVAQVWASIVATSAPSDVHRPAAAAGRAAVGDQLRGQRGGQPRVAGQLVAGAEPAGRALDAVAAAPARDEVLGQQPGRHPQQLVVGQRRRGRRPAGRTRRSSSTPTSSRSGRPRPGRAGGEHPLDQPVVGRSPARLSRRSSSSCWAPGRNRPPAVRGASAAVQSRHGVVPPARRCVDPGPGAGPAGLDRAYSSAQGRGQPRGPRGQAVVGVGSAGRLEGQRHEGVERRRGDVARRRLVGVVPVGVRRPGGPGAARRGRRPRATPAPLTHSIQPWATSSAQS